MCACRETDVRKSAEKFHPFYAAAVFPWWLNALYIPSNIHSIFIFCEHQSVFLKFSASKFDF
jgi:hypothetical protein